MGREYSIVIGTARGEEDAHDSLLVMFADDPEENERYAVIYLEYEDGEFKMTVLETFNSEEEMMEWLRDNGFTIVNDCLKEEK